MADATERHGKTLFVRNLPYSTTNESLEKVFSDVGPLKSCFVVKDKDSGKCRGFGYVKFTLLEDAEKALATVKKVDGRNAHIVYANKKEKKKRFGQSQRSEDETSPVIENSAAGGDTRADVASRVHKGNMSSEPGARQSSLQSKPQKKLKKGVAVEPPVKGQRQAPNPLNEGKRARLIVRNLAFKCSKEELQKAFEKCGRVVEVHIPTKPSGTCLGFGFVQFENKAQAGMAVVQLNGSSVAGRPVAVDWALPKNMYESRLPAKQADNIEKASTKEESASVEEEEEDMEVDDKDDNDKVEVEVPKKTSHKQEKAEGLVKTNGRVTKLSKSADEEGEDDDDDDDVYDDDEEDNEEDEKSEESEDESSSDEDESSSDEDREDGGFGKERNVGKKLPTPQRPSDVGEERTIFIRNLPFSTDETEIEECFRQFGDVKYARIVKDRNSGMSKGSAFVQFSSKDGASASLDAAANESTGGISLQGRQLIVSLAVSREQAGELTRKKEDEKKQKKKEGDKTEEKDSRNLYLSREGMIRPGTEAAKDVPPVDLALRTKIAESNRQKLKDQNVFVSSTRLCVHNIPPTLDDAKLKKILLRAAGDREARLTECRIMRDLTRVNSQGKGKSKGFAFCSFTEHTHALAALRKLNNCPNVFGDKKRPIVEFSLENRKALEAKQKRLEKSQIKAKPKPKAVGGAGRNQAPSEGDSQSQSVNKKRKKRKQVKNGQDKMPLDVKKQQDKIARSMYKGPLGLPSHSGPKQRHKPRPAQQGGKAGNPRAAQTEKKFKQGTKMNNPKPKQAKQKPMKMVPNSNKKRKDIDGFDKLVASYKKKIMSSVRF